MSANQFIITAIIAMLLGGALCLMGSFLLAKLKEYYNKLTFKHEVLAPYTPNKKKRDK